MRRSRKAKKPLHSLRSMFCKWRERFSRFFAKSESNAPRTLTCPESRPSSDTSVLIFNLQDKWKELKQEKENHIRAFSQTGRFISCWRKGKKWLLWSGGLLIVLSAAVCAAQYLRYISKQRESDLTIAVRSADWVRVRQNLALAKVSVYHFFNPHLQQSVGNAESWIQRQKEQHELLHQKIADIESGKTPLDTLSIHAVADIERSLRTLAAHINDLSPRWNALHVKNIELFRKNKNYVMAQLLSQPDINSLLTLHEKEDISILKAKIEEWNDFLETCRSYDIPAHLQTKGLIYLEELKRYHNEVQLLLQFKKNVQEAVTYNEFIAQVKNKKAEKYGPAIRVFDLLQSVPPYEQWQKKMYPIHRLIPDDKNETAKTMLLRGGATYSAAFPVSQKLYALANELFVTPSLHQRFYQVFHADGQVHLSDEFPQRKDNNRDYVSFSLSAFDTAFSSAPTKSVSWEQHNVRVRSICSASLMQDCKINREELFLRANFPRLLEQIITVKAIDCPTLSRAFVFHRVLRLLLGHPFFSQHLQQFAPTLAADAASFAKLHKKHERVMHCGAWLLPSPLVSAAEKDFAHWFKAHQNRDYCGEITTNAAPMFSATPRYVGVADETGKPTLRIPLKHNMVIWYMGADGIRAATPGTLPEDALPYSPLFINSNLH